MLNPQNQAGWIERARRLAYFTVIYNVIEAAACAWFGVREDTLSVLGFGGDSLLEALSGGIVLWRFRGESSTVEMGHRDEQVAHRLIGGLLFAFAASLMLGLVLRWQHGGDPGSGIPGLVISSVSLATMGLLYAAKVKTANALDSKALRADAFATLSCMWLSALLFVGSVLLESTSLAIFDTLTTVVIAVLLVREGLESLEGEESDEE
jgi:divalent metal cation (Fe/Co/Zn/Cd) transporter